MARNRQGALISMRKIRELLRLYFLGVSQRKISLACKVSRSTVQRYTEAAEISNLNQEKINEMADSELLPLLNRGKPLCRHKDKAIPDFSYVHSELTRPHLTLMLLWEEYCEQFPETHYSYSTFCDLYKKWSMPLNATLRKAYKGGEVMFLDFSGKKISYQDPKTGESKEAELFVAVCGASNKTYCEVAKDQTLYSWIRLNINAIEFMGGVPLRLCPDNLKAGTSRPCRYDPDINPVYFDMAKHYNTTVLPSRPGKPRDKAKVECAVLLAQRWILACLRNRQFFSIPEINQEIKKLLEKLNNKPMQKLGISRNQLFENMEKDKLLPLPEKRYEFVQFGLAKVNKDYHIELRKSYYSVPFRLIGQSVSVRYSDAAVEIFYNNERVASHRRIHQPGAFSTDNSHRPENHKKALEWSPERLKKWAEKIGSNTKKIIESIFESLRYEEHGIRRCLGILSLAGKHGPEALETACQIAYKNKLLRHKYIKTIIENNKIHSAKTAIGNTPCRTMHENVRGASYYSQYANKGVKNAV